MRGINKLIRGYIVEIYIMNTFYYLHYKVSSKKKAINFLSQMKIMDETKIFLKLRFVNLARIFFSLLQTIFV